MKVSHELTVFARCPVDGSVDKYVTTVSTSRLVKVETIIAITERFETETLYQEDLTARLAELLDAYVSTVGTHSGVKTTCTVGSP